MDLNEKFLNLHTSLMTLAHDDSFVDKGRTDRLKEILKQCAIQLDIARASIWVLNEVSDNIQCELLYNLQDNHYESGLVLLEKDYPCYFKAITQNRIINANNALKDDRTSEFDDSYLKPLGIVSMLDAPIFFRGEIFGVLCIEQTQKYRTWDVSEMSYAASVADTISLINEHEHWLYSKEKMELIDRSDSLTHLENRRYFQQRLEIDWNDHKNSSRTRALIILGLDDFTKLNDTYGTKIADDTLLLLTERFQELSQKEHCHLSRLGGDTFGFWIPKIKNEQKLKCFIENVSQQVNKQLTHSQGVSFEVSGSMGVFIYPNKNFDAESPIRCAEAAMAWAKKKDRGSVAYYSSAWMEEIQSRREQEEELIRALDEKQLRAHYQPIYSAKSREIVGLEALVRWQHPTQGLITPFHFLPLAAELGLMVELGRFMMRQACSDISRLRKSGVDVKWVSINLSADQLYDRALTSEVESLLNEFDLPGDAIEFEIIEELISNDSDRVKFLLLAISNLGIKLSIDDFGTGFSSLSRLKHLPVSKLKIDKSFVDGLPDSIDDQCIVQSIIGLAKGMNLDIVAEGVENAPQGEWLTVHECDYLQGYLYAKPMNFDAIQSLLIK